MAKFINYVFILLLAMAPVMSMAEDKKGGETKVLSGMSIVGNSEAPKSLTIIPWKNSEISAGKEIQLAPNFLMEGLSPVDKDVFMRELVFYKLSNPD